MDAPETMPDVTRPERASFDLGRFEPIDDRECAELLRTHGVARIGFQASEGIVVLPVTYTMVDDSLLVFGTRPGSVLSPLNHPGVMVAFEIDELDHDTATGWSVLAQGYTEQVDAEALAVLRPWAPGNRSLPVGVRIIRRSGRVISRADQPNDRSHR